MNSPEGAALSNRYHSLSEEELSYYREVGALARLASERGERPFKRVRRPTETPVIAIAHQALPPRALVADADGQEDEPSEAVLPYEAAAPATDAIVVRTQAQRRADMVANSTILQEAAHIQQEARVEQAQ